MVISLYIIYDSELKDLAIFVNHSDWISVRATDIADKSRTVDLMCGWPCIVIQCG